MNPILSVVVPCFNEKNNLEKLALEFANAIKGKNVEVILVDNGSTDGSIEEIRKLEKKYSFIKDVRLEKNIGYGFGIYSGLKETKGEFVAWTHADLQTPPKDVIKALEIAQLHNDYENIFVKGRRTGRPFFDAFFSFGMVVFCSIVLGKWLSEINAQPNLFHKSFLAKMSNPPNDFSFDLYAFYIAKMEKMRIIRIPVVFGKRLEGESSWNSGIAAKMKFIKRTINFTIKLRKSLGEEYAESGPQD